ncbi:MAG: dethiobiotin synthase [Deltaproteobacteria bacterium]|nr:dethiobiotin synthase [Deltaproteobacteria bacterium]MBI3294509.1 dethiobiotin synthase [Deltaproteobacteria bacterium]
MEGVFVTGTDTGVGKTTVCAGLLKAIYGSKEVVYWKPVQTGTIVGDDTREVKAMTQLPDACFKEPSYRFPDPVSPHMAAEKWGKTIELDKLVADFQSSKQFQIVEGAGGILVPFNDSVLQIDFIKKIGLPVIIVGQDRVGAINHTLLTLDACRKGGIPIKGVILTRCRMTLGNGPVISKFGQVEVLATFTPTDDPKSLVAQVASNTRLRQLFNVAPLPG